MECSDLSFSGDHWFAFMEEHQMGSRRWFRKFLEGLVQERGQKHIPEVSGVTDDGFRSSWEIIPKQCDEPLGSEVVLPLVSEQFLEDLLMRSCLVMDPFKFLSQKRP